MNATDRAKDSIGCYEIWRQSCREMGVRSRQYEPKDETERRWLSEGPRDWAELDTVKYGHWEIPFTD